jgi:hypothetical protein
MCDHAATSGREVAWARASWLGSHAPLREAVLEFYEALVVPLVGNGVAAWRGGCPNGACAG